ncbi:MAG: YraN family protein [Patescibacteria group bacterium]
MTSISTGKSGENIATKYLQSLRWKIIERNFKKPWGEIDIIAKDTDGTLVFVEVKAMRQSDFLTPEDNMSRAKLKKVARTASLYAASNTLVREDRGWRIDLIAIELSGEEIRHYKNVM